MPCTYCGTSSQSSDRTASFENKQKIKRLESLLCSASRVLEKFKYDFDENPLLSEWWDNHKEEDEQKEKEKNAARLRKERALQLSKKSIKDLTKSEIRILKQEGYL